MAETMRDLLVIYNSQVEIDIGDGETENFVRFGSGFNSLSEELNEVVQQYFFLDSEGYAENFVTGIAPVITTSGVRVVGDAAQDYLFDVNRKYGLMNKRRSKIKLTRRTGQGYMVVTCPVTLCNMSDMIGESTDGAAVSVELRFDGKPKIEAKTT